MELLVERYKSNDEATIGKFFINGEFECYTVEDQKQDGEKVRGETRVGEGTYKVKLRAEGGFHNRYAAKYGSMHQGMLCIHTDEETWKLECPNGHEFQFILIHVGNTDDDTHGCLLLNTSIDNQALRGGGSVNAYKKAYPKIASALLDEEEVIITYVDIEEEQILA